MKLYSLRGKPIEFEVDEYLKGSSNIERSEMPQINMSQFMKLLPQIKDKLKIVNVSLPANVLKPTQNEINMDKVFMSIAKKPIGLDMDILCSKSLHITDGHHRHVHNLIVEPTKLMNCFISEYQINDLLNILRSMSEILLKSKTIDDTVVKECLMIIESYGIQGPEAVQGMGPVILGQPATSEAPGIKGSGDMPQMMISVNKNPLIDDEDDDKKLESLLQMLNTSTLQINDKAVDETWVATDSPDNEIMQRGFITQQFLKSFGASSKIVDGKIEVTLDKYVNGKKVDEAVDNSKKLPLHYDNADGLELLTCINLPIERKCIRIDDEFSCGTLEGITVGKKGDYLMQGVDGEIYPCDYDIFHRTYQIMEGKSTEVIKENVNISME